MLKKSLRSTRQRQTWTQNFAYCPPNSGAAKCINQLITKLKQLVDNGTITAGDLKTPPPAPDRSSQQKISKQARALGDTSGQGTAQTHAEHFLLKQQSTALLGSTQNILQNRSHSGPQIRSQRIQKNLCSNTSVDIF